MNIKILNNKRSKEMSLRLKIDDSKRKTNFPKEIINNVISRHPKIHSSDDKKRKNKRCTF